MAAALLPGLLAATVARTADEHDPHLCWHLFPRLPQFPPSYPFDNTQSGASIYSKSPDDDVFRQLAHFYASNHAFMANNKVSFC